MTPCRDCGRRYPHYVMEWDHRPGETKTANVAQLQSYRAIVAEINKCDAVCANCHAVRTWRRLAAA